MICDLLWLWKVSGAVCDRRAGGMQWWRNQYEHLRIFKNRLIFMVKAMGMLDSLQTFLRTKPGSALNRLIAQRPETVGAVVWPYQCNTWDAKTRLKKIEEHYRIIEELFPAMDFHVDGALKFVNLDDVYDSLHVVIDRPQWFLREGQLTLNLFLGNIRIYSLVFSFAQEADGLVSYVGALQGRDLDGIQDTYKKITKELHGIRPRDLLFELFRVFCRAMGLVRIYAVAEDSRHHRSRYFSKAEFFAKSGLNYDSVWQERGGKLETPDFYVLGVEPHLKGMVEIKSSKRSMYRQRYILLERLELQVKDACAHLGDNRLIEYPFRSS